MINKLGGRKVLLGMAVIQIGIAIDLFFTKGLSTNLLYLLTFISSGFFLSNGVEHVAVSLRRRKSRGSNIPPQGIPAPGIPIEEVGQAVNAILTQNAETNQSLGALTESMESLMKTLGNLANRRTPR